MIRAILFDMDGTLVDSERYYTEGTYEWMKRYGFDKNIEDIYEIIGTSMEETAAIINRLLGNKMSDEEVLRINEEYFTKENVIDFNKYIFPEVYDLLHEFKDMGLKMCLCSASQMKEIQTFVNTCGLDDVFDKLFTTYDCENHKPHPEVYLKALDYLALNKDEVIIVEDSKSGIEAGVRAKIYTLARKDTRFGINQSLANKSVKDLYEVKEYIKKVNENE